MADPPRSMSIETRLPLLAAAAVAGVLICWFVYAGMLWWERRAIEARFRLDAEQQIGAIHRDFASNVQVAESISAFYKASQRVDHDE